VSVARRVIYLVTGDIASS
ncbi:hypothetical protein, partial [Frankia sp. AvcI1]